MLLILANALLWACLPALLGSWLTLNYFRSHPANRGWPFSTHQFLRATEVFLAWLILFSAVFGLFLWTTFRDAGQA